MRQNHTGMCEDCSRMLRNRIGMRMRQNRIEGAGKNVAASLQKCSETKVPPILLLLKVAHGQTYCVLQKCSETMVSAILLLKVAHKRTHMTDRYNNTLHPLYVGNVT